MSTHVITQHRTWPAPAHLDAHLDDWLLHWAESNPSEHCLRCYTVGGRLWRACAMERGTVIATADAFDLHTATLAVATQLAARELARVEALEG